MLHTTRTAGGSSVVRAVWNFTVFRCSTLPGPIFVSGSGSVELYGFFDVPHYPDRGCFFSRRGWGVSGRPWDAPGRSQGSSVALQSSGIPPNCEVAWPPWEVGRAPLAFLGYPGKPHLGSTKIALEDPWGRPNSGRPSSPERRLSGPWKLIRVLPWEVQGAKKLLGRS